MKELCTAKDCRHPRDMHAAGGGYCSICGCPYLYVSVELHANDDIVTNAAGGSQSRLDFDFTQLDADMLMRVARVLNQGAQKYGEKNWQKIPTHDHINHMIYHAIMANTSDTSEDHLANTICRAMFAMWTQQTDLVVALTAALPKMVADVTQVQLDALIEPPFGYRKFDTYPSDSGPITAPMNALWCMQCPHDAKDHIITPNIEGDCLVCAKCGCRQQLLEDDTWCQTCKHPMGHHKDNIDIAVCECGCMLAIAEDPPTPSENICKCGHHVIAHQEIGAYPARGSCRNEKCPCLRFDPSTEAKLGQDKPSRSRPYGPGRRVYAPQEGSSDKTVEP